MRFFFSPQTRAATVHWMLEETGAEYDLVLLDLKNGERRQADYLAINPMGKVPAIVHQGVAVTEVSAISTYLADAFPQKALAPPLDDPQRGAYYRWIFFTSGCIEPAMTDKRFRRSALPRETAGYGGMEIVLKTRDQALSQDDYLLGNRFSAADLTLWATLNFALKFSIFPQRDAFAAYVDRLTERNAFQRAQEKDGRWPRS